MSYGFETSRSRALVERLRKSLPGGDTRSITYYEPYPLALARGSGYRVWDVDGNEFIDLLNNYTALYHGHAHPVIAEAIGAAAREGTCFPAPHEPQAELAERICGRFASIERVRFTNSGSEADMMAIRTARAFTGRDEIVKADGGYHGLWEQVPMSWGVQHGRVGAGEVPAEIWDLAIPKPVQRLVHMIDFNDPAGLEAVLREHGDRVAAVILEPVLGEGVVAGDSAFFARARELCDAHGALLILDEVITARLHPNGYQAVLGVRPDLTVLGKGFGGGVPAAAFGGRADVMDVLNPRLPGTLSHAGTFNGNPLAMAAGRASLDLLTASEIERINGLGAMLADGLREALAANGLTATITAAGSLVHVHFDAPAEITSFADVNLHSELLLRLHLAALEQGVYIAPRGTLNTSTAMDEAVVEEAVARLDRALQRVAQTAAVGAA